MKTPNPISVTYIIKILPLIGLWNYSFPFREFVSIFFNIGPRSKPLIIQTITKIDFIAHKPGGANVNVAAVAVRRLRGHRQPLQQPRHQRQAQQQAGQSCTEYLFHVKSPSRWFLSTET